MKNKKIQINFWRKFSFNVFGKVVCVAATIAILAMSGFFINISKIFATPVTIAAFDTNELDGNEATFNATTNNANLNTAILSRGAGITPWPLANGFSSRDFVISGTKATAISNAEYYQAAISAKTNYKVSLSSIDFNLRKSSSGPNIYQWQYSLDGFATSGIDVGAQGSVGVADDGSAMPQIDLSGVAGLQNVAAGTVVTFRLYAWGATGAAGTFAIGRLTGDDLVFNGNVDLITYTLAYAASANGSITGTSPQTVDYNASGSAVTAVPATGYHFVNWSDDSTSNPRTDANVAADISATASFAVDDTGGGGGGGGGGPPPEPALQIFEETIKASSITENSITLVWSTNFASSSYVIYSTEGEARSLEMTDAVNNPPKYGYAHATPEYDVDSKVTSHSVAIIGLSPKTTYYFRTVSRGSLAISGEYKVISKAINSAVAEVQTKTETGVGEIVIQTKPIVPPKATIKQKDSNNINEKKNQKQNQKQTTNPAPRVENPPAAIALPNFTASLNLMPNKVLKIFFIWIIWIAIAIIAIAYIIWRAYKARRKKLK